MEYNIAKEKAIKYIGIAKKTEQEVAKKLKSLDVDSLTISKIIDSLKDLQYVDDTDYVRAYIRQNIRMEKYSIYELKQKLLQKGVNICIIETEFENMIPDEYELRIITRLLCGKIKDYDKLKQKEYLYRRGFKLERFGDIYEN